MNRTIVIGLAAGFLTAGADAQSLYQRQSPVPTDEFGNPRPDRTLVGVSMMVIEPPEPRTFEKHDLVTIIVNESSSQSREHTLETEKEYDIAAQLAQLPNFRALLQDHTIQSGQDGTIDLVDFSGDTEFSGEGAYERSDRIAARITAEIIDIKPNGVLVVEARTRIKTDEEDQLFVLSGTLRQEDITESNTVQSSQVFDLNISVTNSGEVRKSAKKGWISRTLDTIFDF